MQNNCRPNNSARDNRRHKMRGVTMIETAILIAVIALTSRVAINFLGVKSKEKLCTAANSVGGVDRIGGDRASQNGDLLAEDDMCVIKQNSEL